jgi:hypothetical protein
MFAFVEPPHSYVQETSASVVHHVDYLNDRVDHALCGVAFENPTTLTPTGRSEAICRECEAKLVVYHLEWWRETAKAATAELEALRVKYRELEESTGTQRPQPAEVHIGEDRIEQAETPKTLLDHARRELTELCRQFDGAVPFVRLKNAMQAFSDKLDTDERVQLAQEVGGDGTLIRWSTTEVEALGWHVINNPMQGESDATWDAWIEDSYQAPTKTKRRFGRSR